jgi:hypothetical protein
MAEHTRKSLVDEANEPVGKPKKGKGGGSGQGMKIGIIVVCLAAAGVLLAYNFGLIDLSKPAKPAPPTAEDTQNQQDFNKQTEAMKKGPAATGGD